MQTILTIFCGSLADLSSAILEQIHDEGIMRGLADAHLRSRLLRLCNVHALRPTRAAVGHLTSVGRYCRLDSRSWHSTLRFAPSSMLRVKQHTTAFRVSFSRTAGTASSRSVLYRVIEKALADKGDGSTVCW
jgi:hypothetical protein